MNSKKILIFILVFALTIPMMSCAKKPDDNSNNNGVPEDEIIDSIPNDYNLDGQTIGIFYRGTGIFNKIGDSLDAQVLGDEESTDIVFSKIYERNVKVENRLNVKLNHIASETTFWRDFCPVLRKYIQQMDNSFEIVVTSDNTILQERMFNLFQDLNDSNYIDIEKPWWYKNSILELSVDSYCYRFLYGDNYIGCLGDAGAIFYNKELYSEYVDPGNPNGIYDHVKNGTWTLEQFDIECENSFVDMGSEETNIYGYSLFRYGNPLNYIPIGCDIEYYKRDSKGFPVITVYNDKSVDVVNKMYQLLYNNKGAWLFYPNNIGPEVEHANDFENNRVMFMLSTISDFVKDSRREMEKEFGCVPYPKYNVEQEEYISFIGGGSTLTAIPYTVKKDRAYEEISAVVEAIASQGYKTVKNAFYEQACKRAYSRDDTTAEMLDIITGRHPTIKSKLVKNFLFSYSTSLSGCGAIFSVLMSKGPVGAPNFASHWESIETAANTQLQKLIDMYLVGNNDDI